MPDYIIVSLILQERNDIIRQNFTLLEEISLAAFDAGILPYYCEDFLVYLESILGKSKNTVNEYYYDLLLFFRYMKVKNGMAPQGAAFSEIPIADFSVEDL